MKVRLITAITLAAALLLGMSGAQAGPPTMDGKKVKVLTLHKDAGTQDHDQEFASTTPTDYSQCSPDSKCAKLSFVYKPAKGTPGGLMITAAWGKPVLTDFDLYAYEMDKRGNGTDVGHCGGSGGNSEKVYLDRGLLHSGKTYMVVVNFFRSVQDAVDLKVEIGVPSSVKTIAPAATDTLHVNCTLG